MATKSKIKTCSACKKKRTIQPGRSKCHYCRMLPIKIRKGDVLDKDYSDTTYKPYKEPLIKNESGFGYVGAIVQSKTGSHIQCNECGYFFRNLSQHVLNYHEIDVRDYKTKYGLRVNEGLLSPMEKERVRNRFNETPLRKNAQKNIKKAHKVIREKVKKGTFKSGGDAWIPQLRNERGVCRDQLMSKVQGLYEKNRKLPSEIDFRKEYGDGAAHSVYTLFKTWPNFIKEAGLPSRQEIIEERRAETMEKILDDIVDFYQNEGRTPQWSDFISCEELPSPKTIQYYFGKVSNARQAAGVPDLKKVGGRWIEVPTDE